MPEALDIAPLEDAAEAAIDEGLLACQVAVARAGEIAWTRTFGRARPTTRFWVASATKPIVASAIWLLMDEAKLDIARPVAHYIPEFAANGKQDVTLFHLLTHQSQNQATKIIRVSFFLPLAHPKT